MEPVSTSSQALQEEASIHEFFNFVATETLALFKHLEFEFLTEYEVFAPAHQGRTRDHEPPELFRGFLHCYYKDIYGTRPVTRELRNDPVWLSCGFDQPLSGDTIDRLLSYSYPTNNPLHKSVHQQERRVVTVNAAEVTQSTETPGRTPESELPRGTSG